MRTTIGSRSLITFPVIFTLLCTALIVAAEVSNEKVAELTTTDEKSRIEIKAVPILEEVEEIELPDGTKETIEIIPITEFESIAMITEQKPGVESPSTIVDKTDDETGTGGERQARGLGAINLRYTTPFRAPVVSARQFMRPTSYRRPQVGGYYGSSYYGYAKPRPNYYFNNRNDYYNSNRNDYYRPASPYRPAYSPYPASPYPGYTSYYNAGLPPVSISLGRKTLL